MKDRAGFIVNALLFPYLNNAVRMLETGTATRDDIDTAMKGGCNFPMGPLALLDLVGLDTSLAILDALYEEFRTRTTRPCRPCGAWSTAGPARTEVEASGSTTTPEVARHCRIGRRPPVQVGSATRRDRADENGIVGIGADLEPGTLLAAYRVGLFPMPVEPAAPMAWWSPDPRAIIPLDGCG